MQEQPMQNDWRPSLWVLDHLLALLIGRIVNGLVLLGKKKKFIFIVCRWFLYMVFVFLLGAICTRQSLRYDFMIAEKVTCSNNPAWFYLTMLSGCHLLYWMLELFQKRKEFGYPSLIEIQGDFPIANPSIQLVWIALHSPAYPVMLNLGIITQQ